MENLGRVRMLDSLGTDTTSADVQRAMLSELKKMNGTLSEHGPELKKVNRKLDALDLRVEAGFRGHARLGERVKDLEKQARKRAKKG